MVNAPGLSITDFTHITQIALEGKSIKIGCITVVEVLGT